MADPQLENGYTQIPNELLDALIRVHLTPNQWQVLLCIIRKTDGFHKKVDRIANFQIVEATGLCKAVVSRTLRALQEIRVVYREGKLIGFQKDYEKWRKLAESSTELAISSTKVSSPHVIQKIKETIQKKEETKVSISFEQYKEQLKSRFPNVNFELELEKFTLYWHEGDRKLKNPKLALLNWMVRAEKQEQSEGKGGNGYGEDRQRAKGIPGNRPAGAFSYLEERDKNLY